MSPRHLILLADLGPHAAAWSGIVEGRPVVVINRLAVTLRDSPLRKQAIDVLTSHGIHPAEIQEVIDGVCS